MIFIRAMALITLTGLIIACGSRFTTKRGNPSDQPPSDPEGDVIDLPPDPNPEESPPIVKPAAFPKGQTLAELKIEFPFIEEAKSAYKNMWSIEKISGLVSFRITTGEDTSTELLKESGRNYLCEHDNKSFEFSTTASGYIEIRKSFDENGILKGTRTITSAGDDFSDISEGTSYLALLCKGGECEQKSGPSKNGPLNIDNREKTVKSGDSQVTDIEIFDPSTGVLTSKMNKKCKFDAFGECNLTRLIQQTFGLDGALTGTNFLLIFPVKEHLGSIW